MLIQLFFCGCCHCLVFGVRELIQGGMFKTKKTNFGKFNIQDPLSFSTTPKHLF